MHLSSKAPGAALFAAIFLALLHAVPGAMASDRVIIFAAASMKNALDDIVSAYTAGSDADIAVSLGSSAMLANQIRHGAPADLFISANSQWMDLLETEKRIEASSRFDLAANDLILIANKKGMVLDLTNPAALVQMLDNGRLAVGLTDSVPAGIYAKAALKWLDLWETVESRLAETDNVRAALALVAAGEAPLGIVYASDINAGDEVHVVASFPAESHPPITYPAALVLANADKNARAFFDFLKTETAQNALMRHGFALPGGADQ